MVFGHVTARLPNDRAGSDEIDGQRLREMSPTCIITVNLAGKSQATHL